MHKSFLECSRSCLFLLVCLFACGIGLGPPSARGQTSITGSEVECEDGTADEYPCENVDLLSHLSIDAIGGDSGVSLNDVWGWTDPEDLTEYALVGRTDGIAFVDVSTPTDPVYVGELPSHSGSSTWRDVKVYDGHAFIVSEASGHGTQVFDLSQLGDVPPEDQPKTFTETAHYDEVGAAHNIVMNRETGFAYIVGGNGSGTTCGGGLHMVDVQTPTDPVFAGCFTDATYGYTHDAQCVTYEGPDTEHQGDEICLNANEDALNIANVTDKDAPATIVNATYPLIGYVHQAWLTENHEYLYVDDELDELQGLVDQTRTLVFDVTDLENPELVTSFSGSTGAIDHNQYIEDGYSYQANYQSGLRILNVSNPEAPAEVGYFDTYPDGNQASFDGAWSTYPFFGSNMVLISSIGEGLFVVEPQLNQTEPTIVRFSSNSTAVAEDAGPDTLTVTLTETDPTASIEVDVAFNESASGAEADDLDDYTTQTVSFPASASTGDTRSVTVDPTDDADGEGTEVAQFDLTNLSTSGNAEVGIPSQAALSIVGDDRTVAEARAAFQDGDQKPIILTGTVSRAYGSYARLQDESGPTGASAVVVRQTAGPLSDEFQQDIEEGDIRPGAQLRVWGDFSDPDGQVRFSNGDVVSYAVQGQGKPPAPQEVSLGELVGSEEDYESELIEVEGLSFLDVEGDSSFAAETSYTVTDGEETFAFWVGTEEESALVREPVPTDLFAFGDVLGQSSDAGTEGYQLVGIRPPTLLPDPVVRFASDASVVAEDAGPDTLTVTLAETDPTASIEVDVAFNESASGAEADDLDDYTTQTVSFPASASTGDPRSVVVDLTDDADGEGTDVAQFDLTNLSTSGNAEIGGPSQAALSIVGDDWTVAEAREKLRDGAREVVILEGTVSRAYGSYARLQDESGPTGASAVVVRQTVGPLSGDFQQDVQEGTIQPGTELRARGKLSAPGGQIQFDNDDLARYVVQGQGEPPAPQEVSLGELVGSEEDYESELVEVEGLSFPDVEGDSSFAAETSYTVTDGEETFAFWVGTEEESALVGEPIPTGGFTFADVVGQPGDTGDGNYRLIGLQSSTALPVEMAGIDAVQTGRSVELTWKTASETNNAGFHVQHQSESGWATLGFVESKASAGTASDPDGVRDYRYRVQRELEPGTHRFRLKQEDLDGSTNLSETVAVEVGMDEAVRLTTPVPSPASSHTTVSFGVKESTETSVVLYNVLGQRVRTLYEGTPQGGQTQPIDISVETLPSGVYFVRLHADGRTRAERLTVVQ